MPHKVIRFADARTMPWLGGDGITHELVRHPSDGDFDWRLSVAEVQHDGPFSCIGGVDRIITLCSTGRMVLHAPDPQPLERFSPYAFAGEIDVSCTVPDGPTRDFNVMTRRGAYAADVTTIVQDSAPVEVPTGAEVFVLCMDGSVTCGVELREFDLLKLAGSTTIDATGGAAAIVALRPSP